MKLQIVGMEASSGIGKTSGKAYAIGQLHTLANLAPAFGDESVSVGQMGTTYRCDPALVAKVKHLPCPYWADVEVGNVMRFGKREEVVLDIKPLDPGKRAA